MNLKFETSFGTNMMREMRTLLPKLAGRAEVDQSRNREAR